MSIDIIWIERADRYHEWSAWEKVIVKGFLRAHGIDARDVMLTHLNEMVARVLPDGSFELSVWVVERDSDGKLRSCPTCPPGCVQQKRITVPVTTSLPMTHTTWVAKTVTVAEPEADE